MTTSGLVGWLNIRGIECALSFPDEIYSGSPTLITLKVTNRKRFLHSYLLRVRLFDKSPLLTSVQRRHTTTASFVLSFPRRGVHKPDFAVVSSPFPVNFFIRSMEIPLDAEVVVFPSPVPSSADRFSAPTSPGGERVRPQRGIDGDLITISDYSGAEPIRQIHWRLSARHDTLKVKQHSSIATEPVIFDLSTETGLAMEGKLSAVTFLINRYAKENRMVGLKLSTEKVIPPDTGRGHRLRLLSELARYDTAA